MSTEHTRTQQCVIERASCIQRHTGGAQDFWFTGSEKCVPGGPAFDYTYYNTYTAVVGSFTGWIGIVLFQTFMSGWGSQKFLKSALCGGVVWRKYEGADVAALGRWTFRKLFWVTTLMQVVASAFDLLIINRYNIAWGIPDKWFYMFGDAVIGPAVMMFAFMPAVVLTSKLVPKGLESTTYALLAGFQNFGGVVSSQLGIFATEAAGIVTDEDKVRRVSACERNHKITLTRDCALGMYTPLDPRTLCICIPAITPYESVCTLHRACTYAANTHTHIHTHTYTHTHTHMATSVYVRQLVKAGVQASKPQTLTLNLKTLHFKQGCPKPLP